MSDLEILEYNFANKNKTKIEIPVSENNTIEIEQYVHISMDNYALGDLSLSSHDASIFSSPHHELGKAKITIDLSECDTKIDIQGILIKQVKEEIKNLNAEHVKKSNDLQVKLDNLLAIEYKGD